jgi:hypothetical protein
MVIIREIQDSVEYRVMQRVRFIHFMRKIFSPLLIESALMVAALFVSQYWVSFDHVLSNMRSVGMSLSIRAYLNYIFAAFVKTDLIVQTLLVIAFISALLIVRNNLLNNKLIYRFLKPAVNAFGIGS